MSSLDRRRQILQAAERLFGHYGPGKTTIGDIARDAGIGVGSVYLEFASKDAIVAELAGARREHIAVAMRAAARRGDAGDRLAAALEARVEALFQLAAGGAHACDLVTCTSGSRAPAAPNGTPGRFAAEERELLIALVRTGVESGEFAGIEPERAAVVIEHAYASLSPPWLFCLSSGDALRLARDLNRVLIDGLRVRPGRAPKVRERRQKRASGR